MRFRKICRYRSHQPGKIPAVRKAIPIARGSAAVLTALPVLRNNPGTALPRILGKTVALLLAGAVLAGIGISVESTVDPLRTTHAAHALSPGVSLHGRFDADYMGSWQHSSGVRVFCLEMLTPNRTHGADHNFTTVDQLGGYSRPTFKGGTFHYPKLSTNTSAEISWIATRYVTTGNPLDASAAQAAIWKLAAGGSYTGVYRDHLEAILARYDSAHSPLSTSARMEQIIAEAQQAIAAEQRSVAAAAENTQIILTQQQQFSGVAELPSGVVSAVIEGGVFVLPDGSETTLLEFGATGLAANRTVSWRGTPATELGWSRFYPITVTAIGERRVTVTGAPLITTETQFQTSLTAAKPREEVREFQLEQELQADSSWQPLVTTQTPAEFVPHGGTFADTVTFGAAGGDANWRVAFTGAGERVYAPVTAQGTLYGPFLSDPALNPAATVPAGAPAVGTISLTTSATQGPGSYPVTAPWPALEAGYYTWVWDITATAQDSQVQQPPGGAEPALPRDYSYSDGFGRITERQIVPTRLAFKTQVSTTEVAVGGSFTDAVQVHLAPDSGGWLQGDTGERIPAVLHGQAYYSASEPAQQPAVPTDAIAVGEPLQLTVTGPGEVLQSPAFTVPANLDSGYITVVWCLHEDAQPAAYRGRIAAGCDDYGVPSETLRVVKPQVSTQAVPLAAYAGSFHDTAFVTGLLPPAGGEIRFTGYLLPEVGAIKYDDSWQPILSAAGDPERWQATELAQLTAAEVCEVQPIFTSAWQPVAGPSEVQSPELVAHSTGTVHWVEELRVVDPATATPHTVHRGECGVAQETTRVTLPSVITKAVPQVFSAAEFFDTATVSGPLAERPDVSYELRFTAYDVTAQVATGRSDSAAWCTPETQLWESPVIAVNAPGDYRSAPLKVTAATAPRTIFWVETLSLVRADEREILHRGVCGAAHESTVVQPGLLAATGLQHQTALYLGCGLLLAGAVIALAVGTVRASRRGASPHPVKPSR